MCKTFVRKSENRKMQRIFEKSFFWWKKMTKEKYAYASQELSFNARVFTRAKTVVNDVNDARHLLRQPKAFLTLFHIIHLKQS